MIVRHQMRDVRGLAGYGDDSPSAFIDDAKAAMLANPDYFERWDRWKTGALVLSSLVLGVLVLSDR